MGGKNGRVHCANCAHLFYLGGDTRPLCVATAMFVAGPIRKKVEVVGVVSAEERNLLNDCHFKQRFSLRARDVKRWLLWRLNNGNTGKSIGQLKIDEYSVETEYDRKRKLLQERDQERHDFEEEIDLYEEERGEDVFDNGGDGDNDEPGPSGEIGGEDVQDT